MFRDGLISSVTYATHAEHTQWIHLHQADVVLFQRPYTLTDFEILQAAKTSGRKVWVDFDDDYFETPHSNGEYYAFKVNRKSTKLIELSMKYADLVTVSTQRIKDTHQKFCKKEIQVIPNGYDEDLFPYHKITAETGPLKKIIWMRGSKTHDEDVNQYAEDIAGAINDHPDWKFLCYGFLPWHVTRLIKNPEQWGSRTLSMMRYFQDSFVLRPAVMVVPLANNKFNLAKSNIAAIEGAVVGSQVVVPEYLPEFERMPGTISYYDRPESMRQALERAIHGFEKGHSDAGVLRHHVLHHLRLSQYNQKRLALLKDLL
jgi:hypothetical protein